MLQLPLLFVSSDVNSSLLWSGDEWSTCPRQLPPRLDPRFALQLLARAEPPPEPLSLAPGSCMAIVQQEKPTMNSIGNPCLIAKPQRKYPYDRKTAFPPPGQIEIVAQGLGMMTIRLVSHIVCQVSHIVCQSLSVQWIYVPLWWQWPGLWQTIPEHPQPVKMWNNRQYSWVQKQLCAITAWTLVGNRWFWRYLFQNHSLVYLAPIVMSFRWNTMFSHRNSRCWFTHREFSVKQSSLGPECLKAATYNVSWNRDTQKWLVYTGKPINDR